MSFYENRKFWVGLGVAVAGLLILQQFWHWEVERVEVPSGQFLVRIHRWGKDLPPDAIVAADDSYKGIMEEPLAEGRYFLNPLLWTYKIHPLIEVPTGQCLVVMRKFGKPIPPERLAAGDLLAKEGERGIVEGVLRPGSYRLNKYAYDWKLEPAVEVGFNQVGVRTLKTGKDPKDLPAGERKSPYVVPAGYRGVQEEVIPSGTHYINSYHETIIPVEVGSHIVELADIEFPSRDGFILKPHILVEYQVQAPKAPEVLIRLSDEGVLHQADLTPEQKTNNEILSKIILPLMRGYARIEGSNLDARDVIVTDTAPLPGGQKAVNVRERLQKTLLEKARPKCAELGIEIRSVRLATFDPPKELVEQISARDVARVHIDKNTTQLEQYKTKQKLEAAKAMEEQASLKVQAETRRLQATTQATQKKEVELLRLKQELDNAQINLDASRQRAEAIQKTGKADADIINFKNEVEVAEIRRAIQGFTSVQQYAQYQVMKKLAPTLKEIFASDDSEFAKLFATYLSASPTVPTKAAGSGKPAPARAEQTAVKPTMP